MTARTTCVVCLAVMAHAACAPRVCYLTRPSNSVDDNLATAISRARPRHRAPHRGRPRSSTTESNFSPVARIRPNDRDSVLSMAPDRRDEDDHAGRTRPPFLRDWSWIPFVLIFLLVASHVLTYEYTAGTPRPSWLDHYEIRVKDTERLMLYAAAILACATAVRMVLYRVGAESVLRRRRTRLGYRVVLLTLLITTGFNFFYVRRASYNHWWHCYDSYHYGLNPKFYDELGYEHLYDCTVEAAPRKKLWHKTEVRNLKT